MEQIRYECVVNAFIREALFAPPQDRSLPLLNRYKEQGYDSFVWRLNPDPDHEPDECNDMDGMSGEIDELLWGLNYAAPIFELTHVGCKCGIEIYSEANPKLPHLLVRASVRSEVEFYHEEPTLLIGKSSYTWEKVRKEIEEYLLRWMEDNFGQDRKKIGMEDIETLLYPKRQKTRWLDAVAALSFDMVKDMDSATDDEIFQAITANAERWAQKRVIGYDPKLLRSRSPSKYFRNVKNEPENVRTLSKEEEY